MPSRVLQRALSYCFLIWSSLVILSKMIYQLRFVQADLFQHNCTDQVSPDCRYILKVVMSRGSNRCRREPLLLLTVGPVSNRPFRVALNRTMKTSFHSYTSKTDFRLKSFALSLDYTIGLTTTRKWPIILLLKEAYKRRYADGPSCLVCMSWSSVHFCFFF